MTGLLAAGLLLTGMIATLQASVHGLPAARLKPGVFLLAVPELSDPNFLHTVVLLINYNKEGAFGLIVNRPTELPLSRIFPEVEGLSRSPAVLYVGGPVSRNSIVALLRSDGPPKETPSVVKGVHFISSREGLMEAIRNPKPGDSLRVFSGYAGWAPGQLDHEVRRGDWVVTEANATAVFTEDAEGIWESLLRDQQEKIQIQLRTPRSRIEQLFSSRSEPFIRSGIGLDRGAMVVRNLPSRPLLHEDIGADLVVPILSAVRREPYRLADHQIGHLFLYTAGPYLRGVGADEAFRRFGGLFQIADGFLQRGLAAVMDDLGIRKIVVAELGRIIAGHAIRLL
jgi:putative transcriptional regulator